MPMLTYEYDCLHLEGEDKGKVTTHHCMHGSWETALCWASLVNENHNSPLAVIEMRHPTTKEKVVYNVNQQQ